MSSAGFFTMADLPPMEPTFVHLAGVTDEDFTVDFIRELRSRGFSCVVGRTGRGDTVFGAYLARRLDRGVADSLKFAAALASIKMETPGPFTGTVEQVLERVKTDHE